MSLRLKLLLLSLLTLTLPWAGCHYAREMEFALRTAESQSLTAVAQTIATSLQGRTELLYRSHPDEVTAAGPFDLHPLPLPGAPYIDGYIEDWPTAADAWKYFARGKDKLGVLAGTHDRMLYLLLDVHDNRLVFDAPGSSPLDAPTAGDRVWLGFEDETGAERQVFLATTAPGPVLARHIETLEYGEKTAVDEPRIAGAWQSAPGGYRIELRLPLSMLGEWFGVLVDDRDVRGADAVSYGSLRGDDLHTRGRLVAASPDLDAYLAQFLQPGLRLAVTTPAGKLLSDANAFPLPGELDPDRGLLARFYRRLLDRRDQARVIEAHAPISDRDRHRIIGALEVTQTADRWLSLRDRALTKLLNFTLIASLVAVLAMFAFAAHLALRLSRLRRASESALTRDGLVTVFPETGSPDELGDVARAFATLLRRLDEYTSYLRTLAGKLAHEIRTPLTIVRSSLENLESESTAPTARVYLDRARQGSERLNAMLVAMSAATRVEEAIQSAERVHFDLVPVIASAVASYRMAFPQRQFAGDLPAESLEMTGAPDLIVQLLDKLIDNAVDFSPPGSTIAVRLRGEAGFAMLQVENHGPTLAEDARARIFESLWQSRGGGTEDARPHFGLGLYIVRLIGEFHAGHAAVENLDDASGVRFSVRFSRRR